MDSKPRKWPPSKWTEDGKLNPAWIMSLALWAVGGLLLTMFIAGGLTNVDATERAVVFEQDGDLRILEPGRFQWVTPILNTVTSYDVREQVYTAEAIGISLDQQETTTEVTVRYHPRVDAIQTLHQTLGQRYEGKVIVPSVQDCVKDAVSYYNVEQLTGAIRATVKQDIINCMKQDLESANIVPVDFFITDFDFSAEFNAAIERKAVAQQAALEERNRLEQVRYQANQTIVQAEAQARAVELLAEATTGQQGEAYLFLEWLKRWNGQLPEVLTGQDDLNLFVTAPSN